MSLQKTSYIYMMMAKPFHQGHALVCIPDAANIKREKNHFWGRERGARGVTVTTVGLGRRLGLREDLPKIAGATMSLIYL